MIDIFNRQKIKNLEETIERIDKRNLAFDRMIEQIKIQLKEEPLCLGHNFIIPEDTLLWFLMASIKAIKEYLNIDFKTEFEDDYLDKIQKEKELKFGVKKHRILKAIKRVN